MPNYTQENYHSADSYDYKKALYRDNRILEEGIKAADLYKPEKIILTIGNDFFNTDTEKNTTTAGTEQNNDTRYQQMFACGVALHIRAIEELKKHCSKVVVKMMAGNHDEQNANALYTLLYMVYKNDPDVEIDYKVEDTRVASYYVHGDTLLIFDHGKEANGRAKNDAQLGDLMYLPMYEELARRAKHVAIHAGHLHHATYSRLKNGAQVFRNGSPCGDGPWETANGYASDKSHQFYFHSKERGPA